jgi:hypothetical protein
MSVVQGVAARKHPVGARGEGVPRRDVPAERVGEADDHVEERGDVDRVDERFSADSGCENLVRVRLRQLCRSQRQLLDEAEGGA